MPTLKLFFRDDDNIETRGAIEMSIGYKTIVSSLNSSDCRELIKRCEDRLQQILSVKLNEEEKTLEDEKELVSAIKSIRKRTGMGLFDAKQAMDRYRNNK